MINDEFQQKREKIEAALGYRFRNPDILKLAMVHGSYFNEHQGEVSGHNERLEFLGDAVLSLCVAHQLYEKLPMLREGQLTQMRAQIVDSAACFTFAENMGISDCVFIGKGEKYNTGKGRETVVGDFFEALIGALYLDGGLETAIRCFRSHFDFEIEREQGQPSRNWKSQLQDLAQKQFHVTPVYETTESTGPEHAKQFTVVVLINGEVIGTGTGFSKKEAQFQAAQEGLKTLSARLES